MWNRDDMDRINASVDPHDLEEEVYDLPNGEVARVEKLLGAPDTWLVYYWNSRADYDADQGATWGYPRATVSVAYDSYMDAAEQIEHYVKKEG